MSKKKISKQTKHEIERLKSQIRHTDLEIAEKTRELFDLIAAVQSVEQDIKDSLESRAFDAEMLKDHEQA